MLAVDQVVHAEIEPLAGRDGGAVAVLLLVDEGAGLDGQVIAVNAAAAGVEQFGGADPGFAAIDEATIEEADGCVQLGGVGELTHGQHDRQRAPGSVGSSSYPSKVFKGIRMAGRTGGERVKIRGLKVIKIFSDKNLLVVKGAIPGHNGSFVIIEKK